ncbi:MAG: hypothetical protein ACMZI0_11515 [Symbiopectobacterium sp.]|uniref:hypothetical protein n=1 Tax=Symbiopectobacterium sp. TaxID=2952789 RepID=UPI0039ED4668
MLRDVSQHALKSLSCFAAVTFYSTSQLCVNECFINANAMSVLYFLSTIANPLFFMLICCFDNIDNLTRKEVRIKIKNVVFIIVFWNIILLLITFQYIQQGYILQNGIMLTIGIIYIIYPLIIKAMHNVKMTLAFFASLFAIIFLFDIFSPLDMRDDPLFIHSYSFIWIWGGYYILGRMLGTPRWQAVYTPARHHLAGPHDGGTRWYFDVLLRTLSVNPRSEYCHTVAHSGTCASAGHVSGIIHCV